MRGREGRRVLIGDMLVWGRSFSGADLPLCGCYCAGVRILTAHDKRQCWGRGEEEVQIRLT